MRSRGAALVVAALLVVACGRAAPAPLTPAGARGRNVLVVTIDTLRRDRVGAYGHRGGLTPAIDRLAASGVRFTAASTPVPQTLPAHASLLTGRTPPHHGLRMNGAARLADDIPTLATVLEAQGYRTGAFIGAFVLDARYGLARGFDVYDDRYPQTAIGRSFGLAERRGSEIVDAAATWITAPAGISSPWLAWVHLFDPHAPYEAPPEFATGRAPYDAEVAYADAMLGRLLERLSAAGQLAGTLVVVTADHGESLGEHGEATHGLFAYDATLAVPLVMSGPGVGRGEIAAAVSHADMLPTIVDLLGVPAPAGVDGVSAAHALSADRAVYFEALDANLSRDWAPLTGVADARWKYIHLPLAELYDRTADPGETANRLEAEPSRVAVFDRERQRAMAGVAANARAAPRDAAADQRLRALGYTSTGTATTPGPTRTYAEADDPKRLAPLNERFTVALAASTAGRPDEALSALLGLVRERPDFTVARTTAATILAEGGRLNEAVALLRQAPPAMRASPDLQAKLGAVLSAAGAAAEAVPVLERALAAGYANPELLNDLGVAYAQLGRRDDARAAFTALLAIDPDAASAWSNLGLLELGAGRQEPAALAFRRAVAADADRADAWQGLGAALVERDRPGAVEAWTRAERLSPRDFDLLFNLGMLLADGPSPRTAIPYLTRFLQQAPRDRYGRDMAGVEAALRRVSR